MSDPKSTRAANQIAAFFKSYPDEQAVSGIRDHLVAFWTPAMRKNILAHAASGGEGLDPLVIRALEKLRMAKPVVVGSAEPTVDTATVPSSGKPAR